MKDFSFPPGSLFSKSSLILPDGIQLSSLPASGRGGLQKVGGAALSFTQPSEGREEVGNVLSLSFFHGI